MQRWNHHYVMGSWRQKPRTVCMESTHTSRPSPILDEVTKTIKNRSFLLASKNVIDHQVCLGPSVFALGRLKSSRCQKSSVSICLCPWSIPQGWKCSVSSSVVPSLCRSQGYQCRPSVCDPEGPIRVWKNLSGARAQWAKWWLSTAA